jgi:hypothetical protein
MDGLTAAHRWLAATVWLLLAHGVFIVTGYSSATEATSSLRRSRS